MCRWQAREVAAALDVRVARGCRRICVRREVRRAVATRGDQHLCGAGAGHGRRDESHRPHATRKPSLVDWLDTFGRDVERRVAGAQRRHVCRAP